MRDHQRAVAAIKQLLEHDDLADRLIAETDDDIQRFVQHQLLAGPQLGELDARADRDPHLPAAGEHIGRAVVVGLQENAEAGRRLGESVHLLLQGHDLVPGFAQGHRQPLVLPGQTGYRSLGLVQPLLDQP